MKITMKGHREEKKRMDLRQASNFLGLSINGVRSRFKRGILDGERDNKGKIWVYLYPSNEDYNEPSKNRSENHKNGQLSLVIDRLSQELQQARLDHREERERLTVEIENLRAKLDDEREMRHEAEIRAAEGFLSRMMRLIRRAP